MDESMRLADAVDAVPAGAWAVGVSGGADSVALLLLLHERRRRRGDVSLHVAHLDHQLRGEDSAADARFAVELAGRLGVPCSVASREEVEAGAGPLRSNASSRYRAARLALFRRVVEANALQGALLAHHADDVAETVLQRLLRGSGAAGLCGIEPRVTVGGLLIVRPLLSARRAALREFLRARGQPWRDDASNESDDYLRNRLRRFLSTRPAVTDDLLALAAACRRWRDWVRDHTPETTDVLPVSVLRELPRPLAREVARRWLAARGVPEAGLAPAVLKRLVTMAEDAASRPRQHFPGAVMVRRKGGALSATRPSDLE